MIDYMFYRKTGIEDVRNFYLSGKHPDDLLHTIETGISDLPYVDQFETTNNCNLRCRMCPRTENMTRAISTVRDDLFTSLIDQLEEVEQEKKARGITREDFLNKPPKPLIWPSSVYDVTSLRLHHFGSPLLDRKLTERLRYIQQHASFGAQLSETVINLEINKVRELFEAGLERLIIALDGTNAEEFRENRGRDIDYERESDKIHDIAKMKVAGDYKTNLQLQLIDLGGVQRQRFLQIWEGVEGLSIHHKPFFPYPDVDHKVGNLDEGTFDGQCMIPFTSVTILADGRVVPCNSDYNGEEILGDLNNQSLAEVWQGDALKQFRENFVRRTFAKDDLCARCGFYPFYQSQDGNS